MASDLLLPKRGNSVESCIILEWKKAVGDRVIAGEAIVEVESDKSSFDVESTVDGVLLARLVDEGADVAVLSPIAVIGEPGESLATDVMPAPVVDQGAPQEPSGMTRNLINELKPRRHWPISPRARRLADQHGLEVAGLTGSGPNGRIMVGDVHSALAKGLPEIITSDGPLASERVGEIPEDELPIMGVRKIIAERMVASLRTTAQLTMNRGSDARKILEYRSRLKAAATIALQSISINDLVMFAVSRALVTYPEMNATFIDGVIRRYRSVNLGFAVDTERGLMVPVIKRANRLQLSELAAEAHRLAEACRTKNVMPEDLDSGTFSVTNLGAYGVQSFTPVLDAPQVGILGVGSIEPRPVSTDGEITFVPTLTLSLTIDHQIVDGAPAARFLAKLAEMISDFDLVLAQ